MGRGPANRAGDASRGLDRIENWFDLPRHVVHDHQFRRRRVLCRCGKMQVLELPGVIISGIFILVLSLLFSFVVTVPVSAAVAACAYPFLGTLEGMHVSVFGIVGFCVGTLVWLWMWWAGPSGNLYFGSWISVLAVGGLAGCTAGFVFSRQLSRRVRLACKARD